MGYYHRFFFHLGRLLGFIRLSVTWRGQQPPVHFQLYKAGLHSAWRLYATHPPLRYAPYPVAELCHWVNLVPESPGKPCVAECEHILALAGDITNWQTGLRNVDRINRLVAQGKCRFVFTYSAGLVAHSRRYLSPELWHKFGFIYQAYPDEADYPSPPERPFTILTIASRFSDKGIPEALQAFRVLRERHGKKVQLLLVCQVVPASYPMPEGVVLYDTPHMSDELKRHVYRSAHVLYIPCYSDTTGCFLEACAFGVPIVTTRIHHGDEFVQDGKNGYLIQPPLFSYSEQYGVRWKTWEEFLTDLDVVRERGELQTVVDQSVDRLEDMFSGEANLVAMRQAARALHAERFSLPKHNARLLRLYSAALAGETVFPE